MFGAIIGDIVGSVYEFNNVKRKDFPFWTPTSHITDDTICTIAVADIVVNRKDPVQTMQDWCRRYPIGYAKRFQEWVDSPNPMPYESWGNGAVMRISPVGFAFSDMNQAYQTADKITQMTHNHHDSVQAVHAYLTTMDLVKKGIQPSEIKKRIQNQYQYDMSRSVDEIRAHYDKFYVRCAKSVPEAIICALDATSFEDGIRNAVSLGGDSDTLACMAGAIAELRFGVPPEMQQKALTYLDNDMKNVLNQLYALPTQIKTHHNAVSLIQPHQR